MNEIHHTAIVENSVKLGDNIKIGPYSIITGNVTIGDGTIIYSHCSIGSIGEYPGKNPDEIQKNVGVIIGKNCVIRESVTINSAVIEDENTIIGDNCYIMTKSHIGHDSILENNVVICSCASIGGFSKIGQKTYIGINSSIHQRSQIGSYCIVGGQSFFKGNSPDGITWVGIPAIPKKINEFNLNKNISSNDEKNQIIENGNAFINQFLKKR
jgi:UDP-N-acetylglucosamine acyltransferase